jgi:hypothetical protein
LVGKIYTHTKINLIADSLQQKIHDLHKEPLIQPRLESIDRQHCCAAAGCDTSSSMDVHTHWEMPSPIPHNVHWSHSYIPLPPTTQSSGTIPLSSMTESPLNQGTLHALHCLTHDASVNNKCWHGGGQTKHAHNRIEELSDKDLSSLGLVSTFYDTILESHEQIVSSTPCHGDCTDDRCFNDASVTRAMLKHPAWDHLTVTSPERWIEYYKSLCHNVSQANRPYLRCPALHA